MAYGVNAPFGLKPVGSLIGGNFQQTNTYFVASDLSQATTATYAQSIFSGDKVYWNATAANAGGFGGGTIAIAGAANTGAIGVLNGCEYYDINRRLIRSPFWPASTMVYPGTRIKAYVFDDSNIIYDVQVSTSNNVLAEAVLLNSHIGKNANLALGGGGINLSPNNPTTGNINSGQSGYYLDLSTAAATATLQVKILGFSEDVRNVPVYNTSGLQTQPFLNARVILNAHANKSAGTLGTVAA